LCEGGRLHAALTRAGLAGGPRARLVFLAVLMAIGGLPLILLTAQAGTAIGGVDLPLLSDLGVWVRFLVVIPIMVLAEPRTDRLLGVVVDLFRRTRIVREPDLPAFEAAVERTMGRATSDTAELILLVVALSLPHLIVQALPELASATAWSGRSVAGEPSLTAAGRWYAWVSLPLGEFLLLRWGWRSLAWWGLLWRVSKLDLAVTAAHPDRAGGLGFITLAPNAFLPVFFGLSALAAAAVSHQIQFGRHQLVEMRASIIALVLFEAILLLAPQLFFLKVLGRTRRQALVRYGVTGAMMTRDFEDRWTTRPDEPRGNLLDSAHASAMIDFAGTYGLVEAMRPAGISLREMIGTMLPLAVPFAPLLLYQYSIKEILQKVLQLVR
jgi:hypothetical protein